MDENYRHRNVFSMSESCGTVSVDPTAENNDA